MPLGSAVNVDPAGASPQVLAAETISTKQYQGVLVCDASGNVVGVSGNPLAVSQTGAIPAGTNLIGETHDEKPASYVPTSFTATALAYAGTTEALTSLTPVRAGAAGSAATAHSPTASKVFRLMAIQVFHTAGTAAVVRVTFNLRYLASGTATNASPIMLTIPSVNPVATAGTAGYPPALMFPQGLDFPSGYSFGVGNIAGAASAGTLVWVTLTGYEYTP